MLFPRTVSGPLRTLTAAILLPPDTFSVVDILNVQCVFRVLQVEHVTIALSGMLLIDDDLTHQMISCLSNQRSCWRDRFPFEGSVLVGLFDFVSTYFRPVNSVRCRTVFLNPSMGVFKNTMGVIF